MQVEIADHVKGKLRGALRAAGSREIGGVLMGEQIAPGHFRIVDLSIDSQTGGRAHFVRSSEAHAEALSAFFHETGHQYDRFNYLGEWHSHPRFAVTPSTQDVASMIDLVEGERGIEFAVLLIVRLRWWRRISCSCTLFCRSANPSPVDILE
ncbi:Mov34/MPN/PAD-1 family protein [Pseudomonas sp. Irchel s3f7]|uniref:Mov34/MPN/PAD-1 family protein n=1 Tax=Pseudomonas sp. Irchel s3f7 TaxID=2009153 RepID=UPI000BA4CFE2|nr:Mov34/MPN/PAD-1 family protein [Pseudomonas sp. Irchel s3f7]